MKPQVVVAELGKRLPDDAIVNCDSGTIATWWARHVPVKTGQLHTISGNLATMACGLPYTIASQIAYPDRLCVGIRRRWRLQYAHGRVCNRRSIQAADQDSGHQE